ncbi:MAG: rhamnogalacturonan acetylesterase [Myxococcales bacterium]|nr:MAG: rhamnogalacturonan acetylesterase [Myxococcales bacterium]
MLVATLLGCSGGAAPDEGEASGGAGSASIGGNGGSASTAGSGPAGGGGNPAAAGSSAGGGSTAGSGGGAPAEGGSVNGGQAGALGVAGGANGGASGAASGGAGGGSAGGTGVDPSTLPNVTLHLAGDSTVMTYAAGSAQEGWGQELPRFLSSKVSLDNQAIGGASVESFYTGRWKNVMKNLKAGDYVMAAFGANDSGSVEDRHVDPPAFQARYEVMAKEVQAKQATFIVVTPSALQEWGGGKTGNNRLGPYVAVLHAFAEAKSVPLADLNARSLELLNQVGQEAAKQIYLNGDKAHFTQKGATQMAELVADELVRIGSPFGAYVK